MSDLSKPNHYSHDSLGDPAQCTDDHNHPKKYLRVDIELPTETQEVFLPLTGGEWPTEIDEMAAHAFFDVVNYGHHVVDESEVPEDQR